MEEGETLIGEVGGWPTAVVVGWVCWGRMPASHSLEQWEDMEATADSRDSFLTLALVQALYFQNNARRISKEKR